MNFFDERYRGSAKGSVESDSPKVGHFTTSQVYWSLLRVRCIRQRDVVEGCQRR